MPQQHNSSINSQWKRYLFTQVQYTNGYSKRKEGPDYQFEVRHLAAAHSRADISAPERLRLSIALHLPIPRPPILNTPRGMITEVVARPTDDDYSQVIPVPPFRLHQFTA